MRIVMFYRETIAYNTVNYYIDLMAKGLRNLGVEVDIFDIYGKDSEEECIRFVEAINEYHYDAAYTVDAIGQQNLTDENNDNIFDHYHIPFFNRVLDPPYYLDLDSNGKEYYILFTDRDYVDFTKTYYPDIKETFWLPHFASSDYLGETTEQYFSRIYPVTFTGTLQSLDTTLKQRIEELPDEAKGIFFDALDILLDTREVGVEDALARVIKERTGAVPTPPQYRNIRKIYSNLNVFTRNYLREEVLRTLADAGVPIHIWGEGDWESADWIKKSAFVLHGQCEGRMISKIYRQSKVVLNCFPCFKDGSHDRIPTAMMNGAVMMTDHNKYTDSLEGNKDIFLYYDISHTEKAPEILFDALENSDRLYDKAIKGYKYASGNMSAEHAAAEFIKLVRKVNPD